MAGTLWRWPARVWRTCCAKSRGLKHCDKDWVCILMDCNCGYVSTATLVWFPIGLTTVSQTNNLADAMFNLEGTAEGRMVWFVSVARVHAAAWTQLQLEKLKLLQGVVERSLSWEQCIHRLAAATHRRWQEGSGRAAAQVGVAL